MAQTKAREGMIPFDVPNAGKKCETWYKVIGDLGHSDAVPVVAVHGGPGAAHEYMLSFTDLHAKYGIPVIFYDQIGCGNSTRLRETAGDETFWTVDLFIDELENLVDFLELRQRGFDLLGQSWGGMLGGAYGARQPIGLRRLILANAPSSTFLLQEGERALVEKLPQEIRDAIEKGEQTGDYESEAYKKACLFFYRRHLCRLDPWPPEVSKALEHLTEDPTVYSTMYGPSELTCTGNLKEWEGWSEAHKIEVPTLLINGRYDEVQDISVAPWFFHIPKVKWIQLENSSHMAHYEERSRVMQFVGAFLGSKKAESEVDHAL